MSVNASQNREYQAGRKECGRQHTGGPGQYVRTATARHESTAPAHPQPSAFRLLQEDDADHGENNHEVNHDDELLHELCPLNAAPGVGVDLLAHIEHWPGSL